jgi:hypothetical protein
MNGKMAADLPDDVTFDSIPDAQCASLKLAYTRSAALDGVAVTFDVQPARGGNVRLSVRFSPLHLAVSSPAAPAVAAPAKPIAAAPLPPAADPGIQIAWGGAVAPEFKAAVVDMCGRLQVDPNFIMACMAFETGQTFSPSIVNKVSGATGLIQFMPDTAAHLQTTTAELAAMTAVAQLAFVEEYFLPHKGRLKTLSDVYMSILFPAAIGQLESFVLFAMPSKAYVQNQGLDANNDGQVTKAEAAAKVQQALVTGLAKIHLG